MQPPTSLPQGKRGRVPDGEHDGIASATSYTGMMIQQEARASDTSSLAKLSDTSRQQPQPSRYRPSAVWSSRSLPLPQLPHPPVDHRYMPTTRVDHLFDDYDESPPDSREWPQPRPLIDSVTNDWRNHAKDPDDDDDDFICRHQHTWYAPALATLFAAQRMPRRVQRAILTVIAAIMLTVLSWKWFLAPYWAEQARLSNALTGPQKWGYFGANARPVFADLVQLKSLDPGLLLSSTADRKRLVFVGDVHGCKSELVDLLDKIKFRPAADHLVLVGDIVAKGPDSAGVVDLARDLHASCVRGNHEDRILLSRRALTTAEQDQGSNLPLDEAGARNGGDEADKALAASFNASHLDWLEQCPVILDVGQVEGMGHVVVAHAGLVPAVDLDRQDPFQAMNMRTIDLDTKYWNFYMNSLPRDKRTTVIYGHDSKTGVKIKAYSKGLDSGCVNGGRLTALVVEAGPSGGPGKQTLVYTECSNYTGQR